VLRRPLEFTQFISPGDGKPAPANYACQTGRGLGQLTRAGLIRSRRESRSIIYMADLAGTRALLAFLVQDCCRGRPEACAPLLDAVLPLSACCPAPTRPA
jgi:DNA-binding transcriptional ArsR family regulator